ncbi:hypothetical protein JOQ06_011232 [Pogonophryne albipinna]|uniref:Uncharacterized protein n=1 Tax=Pogonophryne albipinna TaxID=1090488 RepID=A0AAD6F572_9TELE|nr:hypothetical protein JOQ06_011232 [Pogonophryne albipinna]
MRESQTQSALDEGESDAECLDEGESDAECLDEGALFFTSSGENSSACRSNERFYTLHGTTPRIRASGATQRPVSSTSAQKQVTKSGYDLMHSSLFLNASAGARGRFLEQ